MFLVCVRLNDGRCVIWDSCCYVDREKAYESYDEYVKQYPDFNFAVVSMGVVN